MEEQLKGIRTEYLRGLKRYVLEKDEKSFEEIHEKSKRLFEEGFSELDMCSIHHKALREVLENNSSLAYNTVMERASAYLKEWMIPFQIKLESFHAVIDELQKKNEKLKKEVNHRKKIQEELAVSKSYFQLLVENAQDIITVLDNNGDVRYDTPSVYRILGYKKDELVEKNVFRLVHSEDLRKVQKAFEKILKNPGEIVSVEFRFRHKKGQWVYLESIAKQVTDTPEGPIFVVNSRDITERKYTTQKLREHKAKLSEAQKIAKVGSWEWKPSEKSELEWSNQMCRIFGYTQGNYDNSYQTFINHVHPDDRRYIEKIIKRGLRKKKSFSFEHKIVRLDGALRYLFCRGRVITDERGDIVKMMGICQDITEQKKKEEKLRQYSNQLRKLSERLERTREEERIRIARELHDELGQMLTVLKMDISILNGKMTKKISGDILDFFNKEAEQILDRINTIINSVQRITTQLRPEVLDDLGLVEALHWQARELEKRTNLHINFRSDISNTDFLNEEESTTIFRVYQEALNNVVRHAKASKVNIELEQKNNNLILLVEDNGIGITEKQKKDISSFGLIGIKERARFLGGDVFIEGKKEQGTKVLLQIPLNK